MRRFIDPAGNHWDVVVGRESWGVNVALFVPLGGGCLRQSILTAASASHAGVALDEFDDSALRILFERSTEKEDA